MADEWKFENALCSAEWYLAICGCLRYFAGRGRTGVNERFRLMGKLNFIAMKVCCTVNKKDRLHLLSTVQTFRGGLNSAWLRHFTSNSHWMRKIVSSGEMGEWVQALHLKCRVYETTR